jgi:hypothetical protein
MASFVHLLDVDDIIVDVKLSEFLGIFVMMKLEQKPDLHEVVADGIVGITTHQHRFVKATKPFQVVVA